MNASSTSTNDRTSQQHNNRSLTQSSRIHFWLRVIRCREELHLEKNKVIFLFFACCMRDGCSHYCVCEVLPSRSSLCTRQVFAQNIKCTSLIKRNWKKLRKREGENSFSWDDRWWLSSHHNETTTVSRPQGTLTGSARNCRLFSCLWYK